jgi:hypothetical protein
LAFADLDCNFAARAEPVGRSALRLKPEAADFLFSSAARERFAVGSAGSSPCLARDPKCHRDNIGHLMLHQLCFILWRTKWAIAQSV